MKGRKPLPTAWKLLQGNAGKRPLNENEPQPTPELSTAPEHLSTIARQEWDRLAPELYKLGLLTVLDVAELASYCQAWADLIEAEQKLQTEGKVILTTMGNSVQNPWLAIRNKAREHLHKFAAEFGFTPSSRSRVTAAPPTDGKDDGLLD